MYRRFPKLKGIAGGMGAGKDKYVVVNVETIAEALASSKLDAGSEVTIESLKSGRHQGGGHYRNLPLKVLGAGGSPRASPSRRSPSPGAKAKIEAAGGKRVIPGRVKWTREAAAANAATA